MIPHLSLQHVFRTDTCHFHTFPCVKFLAVQIIPENAKSDYHVACPCATKCHADILLTSVVQPLTVDF
jgi:hypothetical protein